MEVVFKTVGIIYRFYRLKVNSYVGSRDECSLSTAPNYLQMIQIITDINFSTRSVESLWVLPSYTPLDPPPFLCVKFITRLTPGVHIQVTFCSAKWTIYLQYYCISSIYLFFDTIYSGRFKYTSIMPINRITKGQRHIKGFTIANIH